MRSPFPEDVAFALRQADAGAAAGSGATLLPEERALLSADASAKRVSDFALGRACAREALGLAGAPGAAQTAILRDERRPVWPQGYVGSLAHTEGVAVAAAALTSRYRGLGVDVEALARDASGVARRVLRPEEREALAARNASHSVSALIVFGVKESIFKALHPITGVYLGFQDARVTLPEPVLELGPEVTEGTGGTLAWELLKDSGPGYPVGLRGAAGWCVVGEWLVTGVWVPA
jgi:enterobactin synthetase component D